jgi:hypothetical protein
MEDMKHIWFILCLEFFWMSVKTSIKKFKFQMYILNAMRDWTGRYT